MKKFLFWFIKAFKERSLPEMYKNMFITGKFWCTRAKLTNNCKAVIILDTFCSFRSQNFSAFSTEREHYIKKFIFAKIHAAPLSLIDMQDAT